MRAHTPGLSTALSILLFSLGCRAPERFAFEPHHQTQAQLLYGVSRDGESGVDQRPALGLGLVVSEPRVPSWHYEAGWRIGDEQGREQGLQRTLDYQELLLGVRQVYRRDQLLQPYLGFGGAYRVVVRDVTIPPFSGTEGVDTTDERGVGVYARGGLQWVPSENRLGVRRGFVIGLDLRATASGPYDSLELALALGYRF